MPITRKFVVLKDPKNKKKKRKLPIKHASPSQAQKLQDWAYKRLRKLITKSKRLAKTDLKFKSPYSDLLKITNRKSHLERLLDFYRYNPPRNPTDQLATSILTKTVSGKPIEYIEVKPTEVKPTEVKTVPSVQPDLQSGNIVLSTKPVPPPISTRKPSNHPTLDGMPYAVTPPQSPKESKHDSKSILEKNNELIQKGRELIARSPYFLRNNPNNPYSSAHFQKASGRAPKSAVDRFLKAYLDPQGFQQLGKGKNHAFTNTEIDQIMAPYFKKGYQGAIPRDYLKFIKPTTIWSCILNTDPSTKEGEHWVAIFCDSKNSKSIEYYDSFGDPCPPDIQKTLKYLVDKMKLPYLLRFKVSTVVNQSVNTANCGPFAIRFLMERYSGVPFWRASGFESDPDQKQQNVKEGESSIEKFKEKHFPYL